MRLGVWKSLQSIQHELKGKYKHTPSISMIHRTLNKSKVSCRRFTNTKVCPKSKESLLENIIEFKNTIDQLSDDEMVCLDETGFCNIGNSVYGYFPKGKQPIMHFVPKRLKMSLMMAIGHDHVINYKITRSLDILIFFGVYGVYKSLDIQCCNETETTIDIWSTC